MRHFPAPRLDLDQLACGWNQARPRRIGKRDIRACAYAGPRPVDGLEKIPRRQFLMISLLGYYY